MGLKLGIYSFDEVGFKDEKDLLSLSEYNLPQNK